jgi:lipoprotein-releasing system permease protein
VNVSKYISQKLTGSGAESFSSTVSRIAVISIAVGLAIMLVSFAILEGFRNEIQAKIFGFGAHLHVSKYDTNNSYEGYPISTRNVLGEQERLPGIRHIQPFARKTAIIKTDEDVLGVVLKGVDQTYDLSGIQGNLVAGNLLSFTDTAASDDVLLSQKIASKLRLQVGDRAIFYFIQNPPRVRRLNVVGIYKTGLDEFDEVYAIGDLRQVRELNNWADTLVGGYEIYLNDFRNIDQVTENIYEEIAYDLQVEKITDRYAPLFDWLELLRKNVVIFLILIMFVATFNMVSTVFIMILERTNMIGILKALGATDQQIRRVFFFKGLQLTLKGLVWGNVIGLGFCLIQYYFKLIPLDPENYYMDTVPINWNLWAFVLLNLTILFVTMLAILIPSVLISRIRPVTAIRFD